MQFSSIWPINRTLSGATILGQSGSGSNGNEEVLHISQHSSITGTSPSDCLVSYAGHSLGKSYSSAEMQSVYSTTQADWASWHRKHLTVAPFFKEINSDGNFHVPGNCQHDLFTDCCAWNFFVLLESQCVSTSWMVFSTQASICQPMFSQFVNIFLTKGSFSIHISHSCVNFTWFALICQKFDDRPLFKPGTLCLQPYWIASKEIFLWNSNNFCYKPIPNNREFKLIGKNSHYLLNDPMKEKYHRAIQNHYLLETEFFFNLMAFERKNTSTFEIISKHQ